MIGITPQVESVKPGGKKIGRPKKQGELLESLTLSLPPSMIEQMRSEQTAQSADSVSAIGRAAIGDYLRRMEKRRERGD